MFEPNTYKRATTINTNVLDQMCFALNADVLMGCTHTCKGCFVNKFDFDTYADELLENAYNIAKELVDKGFFFKFFFIGATDFLSSKNRLDILKHPTLHKIMRLDNRTALQLACIFETDAQYDRLKEAFKILDNEDYYRRHMLIELGVPVDVQRLVEKDPTYLKDNDRAVEFLKLETPKTVSLYYTVNVHNYKNLEMNYVDLTNWVRDKYESPLDINPSFFRSGNQKVLDRYLKDWKNSLDKIITEDTYDKLFVTGAEPFFAGMNTVMVHLYQTKAYISPFIYEQIQMKEEMLEVEPNADAVLAKHSELIMKGFQYASSKTSECNDCKYLSTCVGRKVQNVMEIFEMQDCIFPEGFKKYYADARNPGLTVVDPNNS